jgi:hypothetical protein
MSIFLLVSLSGLSFAYWADNNIADSIYYKGYFLAEFCALVLLLRNGTLIKTVYFKFVLFFSTAVFIGVLFKVMHWPGATVLITSGLMGISFAYVVNFFEKIKIRRLDIFKLAWVFFRCAGALFVTLRWPYGREVLFLSQALFWFMTIDLAYSMTKIKNTSTD